MRRRYYSAKRRAIMARGEQINHTEVFEAHGWICHLCGDTINRYAGPQDWMRVSLDHVIPLSRGGQHIWENVKPAHLKCNQDKGNKLSWET